MNTKFSHYLFVILLLLISGCNKTRISAGTGTTGGGGSIYANPDALTFTPEHHAYMLQTAYLSLAYTFPPQSDMTAISEAADNEAAQTAYETAIDTLVDSGVIKERLIDYGINLLGVGDKYAGTEQQRYPANLFAYVVLTGKKIDEFLLADYAISDSGTVVTQAYSGGPPTTAQAGYITMEEYTKKYMNTRFMFKMIREVLGTNLNTKAPFNNVTLYKWTDTQVNPKYNFQQDNPVICLGCHSGMNNLRSAFHKYNGAYNTYNAGTTQGVNQYGQEDSVGDTLEPRASNGNPLTPAQAASLYKLTEGGNPIASPRDLAEELILHSNFPRAWTERLLTILLNIDEGQPGGGNSVPNHFSSNDTQIAFIEQQTAKFSDLDRKPKDYIKYFLKSNAYLVTGYNPEIAKGGN